MKPSHRLRVLLAILSILAGLVILDEPGKGAAYSRIVEASPPRSNAAETARSVENAPGESSALLALRDRHEGEVAVTGFEVRDWTAPPQQPGFEPELLPPPPSPPPQAPPLPFDYLGKQRKDGKWTVFLAHLEYTYIVTEGMKIGSDYRIEKIAPPTLSITYLPLRQRQTLAIGSAE